MDHRAKLSVSTWHLVMCHIAYISLTERSLLPFDKKAGSNVCSKKTTWEKIRNTFIAPTVCRALS